MRISGLAGRESVRLLAVAVVAAGAAVAVVEASSGGSSHGSSTSASAKGGEGSASLPASGPAGVASTTPRPGTVAAGAAVVRSLRQGVMKVVIDRPTDPVLGEQNTSIAQGAAVAADELNADGGLPNHVRIKLVTETLDGLSASAVRARLSAQGAAVLILPCDTASEPSLAAAGAAFQMLMLAPCNPDATAARRYPTYWAVGASSTAEAAAMTTYLASDNYKHMFVVGATGTGYSEELANAFRGAARAHGIVVTGSASVSTSSPDFSSVVHAIESTRPLPDGVFTTLPPMLASRLISSIAAKGLHSTYLGSTLMDTPFSASSAAKTLENTYFVSYGFPRVDAAASRFAADYRSDFGRPPVGSFPGLGFETVRLLAAAAQKGGSAAPNVIQRALTGGLTLKGVALASRTYAGGEHAPVGDVGISKVFTGELLQVLATTPPA